MITIFTALFFIGIIYYLLKISSNNDAYSLKEEDKPSFTDTSKHISHSHYRTEHYKRLNKK